MAAKIVKGTDIAAQIREELKAEVAEMKEKKGVVPGLVTILVGEKPGLGLLRHGQGPDRQGTGIQFHPGRPAGRHLPGRSPALIDKYNNDPEIHGILVQLPLPKHINETEVLYRINPAKDVDGFPSGQRGQTDDRRRRVPALHTGRHPGDAGPFRGGDEGRRGGRGGPLQHRGQAHRQHAPSRRAWAPTPP